MFIWVSFKEFLKEASYSGKIEDVKIDNIDPEDKDVVRVQSLNIAKDASYFYYTFK